MNVLKGGVCGLLFLGALVGAVWPIMEHGGVNWLFDMDIRGGVQILYKADFSSIPPEKLTPEEKERLMALSHLRLDARLAAFQGADVRVQRLGEDTLLVEVPGVRSIAKVLKDLIEPKVVRFARVVSVKGSRDAEHCHPWDRPGRGRLWLKVAEPFSFGGNIRYGEMKIEVPGKRRRGSEGEKSGFHLTLPLDGEGQTNMALLTSRSFDKPVVLPMSRGKGIPMIALFLDDELQDAFHVRDRVIHHGAISTSGYEEALTLKRLLSSGPMPVGFEMRTTRAFSPTLGAALQERGLVALALSLVLLLVFIGLCYLAWPWLCFVYATVMIFWFLCLVTLANLHVFRVSFLQLAGFALLLGMNTDALVLVFEDMRQEIRRERRFYMTLVGEAFSVEWQVVFWGMLTTLALIIPLLFQKAVFADYITLMAVGMGVNVLGFIFARLLMSLDFTEQLAKLRLLSRGGAETDGFTGLASIFSRFPFAKIPYLPVGVLLVVVCAVAVFVWPGITLAPVFRGGKAVEVEFSRPVEVGALRGALRGLVGDRAQLTTGDKEGKTNWALVKLPPEAKVSVPDVVAAVQSGTGVKPEVVAVEAMSRTLVATTRIRVSGEMFLGFVALLVICAFIYNLSAALLILLALAHDLLICLGVIALCGIPLDLPAIAAVATMAGYSINDSIVILHKLRLLKREKEGRREFSPENDEDEEAILSLPAENIRRIPARVLITSITTALPMALLAAMTGGVLRYYAVIVLAGTVFGTLSSVYIVGRVVPWGFVRWRS